LARISWTIPIAAFAISTPAEQASWIGPTMRMSTSRPPRSALNSVRTFARTI
jgi:hypothetical protein